MLRFDDQVGVRMIPDLQLRDRQSGVPYLMRTNSEGFRTREIEPVRKPGTRRVLVYGDSFTEGVGVSDGRRFTDVLEELLPNTEFLNFGVRATGTDQQFLLFRDSAPGLEYDLVVIGLYTADVLRNHSKYGVMTSASGAHYQKPYFIQEGDELVLRNVPVPRDAAAYGELDREERKLVYFRGLNYRLRTAVQRFAPWAKPALQRITRYQPAPYLKSAAEPAWVRTRAIVRQWASEAKSPLLVLAIPPYQYVEKMASSSAYRARFEELGRDPGISVHDPLDDLISASETRGVEEIRIPGDAHYSAGGHRVIAESVAPAIDELLRSSREIAG